MSFDAAMRVWADPQEPDVAIEESEKFLACQAVEDALFGLSSSAEEADADQGGRQQHASVSLRSGAASKRGVVDPGSLVAAPDDSSSLLDVKSTQKVAELSPEPSMLAMATAQSQSLAPGQVGFLLKLQAYPVGFSWGLRFFHKGP